MTVSAQLAGVTGPCPQCGQTITAPFPQTSLAGPVADFAATPQPAMPDADALPSYHAPLPPQIKSQASTVDDKPSCLPPITFEWPDETKHSVAKQTKKIVEWGIIAAVLLLLAGLVFYRAFILPARQAAAEALIKRQQAEEQSIEAMKVQNEWMKKFNEKLKQQDDEMMEDLRRKKAAQDEEAKRERAARGESGGPEPSSPKLNFIDQEQGVTDDDLILIGSSMAHYKNGTPKSSLIARTARAPWMKNPVSEWPQILLTNEITFHGHTTMVGASSFVVQADNGSHWLITAEHIISEDGGVDPPLVAEELDGVLREWKAFPPLTPEKFITANGTAPGLSSDTCPDTLAIRLSPSSITSLPVKALKISKQRAAIGQTLYLIGLPFYDVLHPQNVYTCRVDEVDPEQWSFRVSIDAEVMLKRFSGAPLINADGEVAGILTYGYGPASTEVAEAAILEKFISH